MLTVLTPLLLATACKPPATDAMAERQRANEGTMPSPPMDSPDTTDAFWAESEDGERLLYGTSGERALFSLACVNGKNFKFIEYIRIAPADENAKAVLSLIGNSHVERLQIDAYERADGWVWRGMVRADSTDLEPLTGVGEVEATVPGAGSLILNPSRAPGMFIAQCRGFATPIMEDQQEAPA